MEYFFVLAKLLHLSKILSICTDNLTIMMGFFMASKSVPLLSKKLLLNQVTMLFTLSEEKLDWVGAQTSYLIWPIFHVNY